MRHNKFHSRLPDCINTSFRNFTAVDYDLLRNPNISTKAKIILAITLGNREGWVSYREKMTSYLKEGQSSIDSALRELESLGYLFRIQYCNPKTKFKTGSIWISTDQPWKFNWEQLSEMLQSAGVEIWGGTIKSLQEKLGIENLVIANPTLIILKDNYIKKEKNSLCCASAGTAKVSKKEVIPEEKQSINPDKKQERLTTRFKQFSTRLHEIISAHRKITRAARPAGWVNSFRLLYERDGIQIKRINAVLEWYADNIGGQYIPEAYSAASFREKFPKLEAAIERNSGKKKQSRQEKKQQAGHGEAPIPGKYGESGLYFWNYSNYCYDKDKKKVDTQHFTGWKKHPPQYTGPCACDWCKKRGVEDLETITLTGGPHNDMEFQGYMERIEKENETE